NDDFLYSGGGAGASALAVDLAGNVYVAGSGNDSVGSEHWLVRETTDGTNWTTVEDYLHATRIGGVALSATFDATANVVVGGDADNQDAHSDRDRWTGRKSTNEGASWSISDEVIPAIYPTGAPYGMAADPQGNVYAAGLGWDGTTYHWMVRKLANNATTW